MRFLIVSNFYAVYLPLKKPRHLSILLHELISEYIPKLHVSINDSNKLQQSLVSLNFRH